MTDFDFEAWLERMGWDKYGNQRTACEALGITPQYLRKLMKHDRNPSRTLLNLCSALERIKHLEETNRVIQRELIAKLREQR